MFCLCFCRVRKSRNLKKSSDCPVISESLSTSPQSTDPSPDIENEMETSSQCSSGYGTENKSSNVTRSESDSSNFSNGSCSVTNVNTNATALHELFDNAKPRELPKHTAKRASELYNHLPKKNVDMRCGVVVHTVSRMLRSPNSKGVLASMLKGDNRFLNVCDAALRFRPKRSPLKERVVRQTRLVARLRAQRKFDKIADISHKWKQEGLSLRRIAKMAHMSVGSLRWHLNPPVDKSKRKVSDTDKRNCIEFFTRNNITMQLPYKRHANKLYLRSSMRKAYNLYKAEMQNTNQRVLSLSAVHRVLPRKFFRPVSTVPFQQCLCNRCENFRLALLAAVHNGVNGLSRRVTRACMISMCEVDAQEPGQELFACRDDCIRRKCKSCKAKFSRHLVEANTNLNMSKIVSWHQWSGEYKEVNGKRHKVNFTKIRKRGPLADLIGLLKLQIIDLPLHIFLYLWQGEQFELAKRSLVPGEVLMVMDFAKNLQFQRQGEVQGAFWYRSSVTLHPAVCFYQCPNKCGKVVTDEVMCVSNDLSHDAHAVHAFQTRAIRHLKKSNIPYERIIQFTDNCAAQYKCSQAFGYMTRSHHNVERHYFGAGHGKGPADASVGRTKRLVDRASRCNEHEGDFQNAQSVVAYCKQSLGTPEDQTRQCAATSAGISIMWTKCLANTSVSSKH